MFIINGFGAQFSLYSDEYLSFRRSISSRGLISDFFYDFSLLTVIYDAASGAAANLRITICLDVTMLPNRLGLLDQFKLYK